MVRLYSKDFLNPQNIERRFKIRNYTACVSEFDPFYLYEKKGSMGSEAGRYFISAQLNKHIWMLSNWLWRSAE